MPKIYCDYKILDPPSLVNPNDIISGVLAIKYEGKKERTIKKIEIQCHEIYSYLKYSSSLEEYEWKNKDNTLQKWILTKNIIIQPEEMKEFPFQIKLPSTWSPKIDARDWHIPLIFHLKAGVLLSGTIAYCVLPVSGSMRPPSFSASEPQLKVTGQEQTQTQKVVVNISKNDLQESDKEIETKFCSFCGKKIKKEAVFCEFCGGKQ
ncbi:MAG: hypothetical protein V3V33_04525 [Candidatus Lokiarchaeia archaeon]